VYACCIVPFPWIVFDNSVRKKKWIAKTLNYMLSCIMSGKDIQNFMKCLLSVGQFCCHLIFMLRFLSLTFIVVLCWSDCFLFCSCFGCLWTFSCHPLDYLACAFMRVWEWSWLFHQPYRNSECTWHHGYSFRDVGCFGSR